jgi:hypothetical protein
MVRPPIGLCEPNPDPWTDPPPNTKPAHAKRLCAPCPVLDACREYAQTQEWHGVIIAGWYAPSGQIGLVPYGRQKRRPEEEKRHPAVSTETKDLHVLNVLTRLPKWYPQTIGQRLAPDGDCLLWTVDGRVTGDNGAVSILLTHPEKHTQQRLQIRPHRVAFLHHFGAIPEGGVVYRTCGRKGCCAPDHLTLEKPEPEQKETWT